MFDEKVFAERAVRAGAMGYVNKKEPIENVLQSIRQVLDGEMYLSPRMTQRLLRRACGDATSAADPIQKTIRSRVASLGDDRSGNDNQTDRPQTQPQSKNYRGSPRENQDEARTEQCRRLSRRAVLWVLDNG